MNVANINVNGQLISSIDSNSINNENANSSDFKDALRNAAAASSVNDSKESDSSSKNYNELDSENKQDVEVAVIPSVTLQTQSINSSNQGSKTAGKENNYVKFLKNAMGQAKITKEALKDDELTDDMQALLGDLKLDSSTMNATDGKKIDLKTLIASLKTMSSSGQNIELTGKLKLLTDSKQALTEKGDSDSKTGDVNLEQLLLAMSQAIYQSISVSQQNNSTADASKNNEAVIGKVVERLTNVIKNALIDAGKKGELKNFNLDSLDSQIKQILNEQLKDMQPSDKDKLTAEIKSMVQNSVKEANIKNISTKILDEKATTEVKTSQVNQLETLPNNKKIRLQGEDEGLKEGNVPVKNLENKSEVKQAALLDKGTVKLEGKTEETKEDKFLKSLVTTSDISDKKGEINKTIQFIQQQTTSLNKAEIEVDNTSTVINRNNLSNDVVKVVKYMELNNMKELTVKLVPKELGEVVVKLTMENGVMRANITANNKETFQLLSAHLSEINNQLGSQGNVIQQVNINIYQGDTTFFSGEFNRQGKEQNENGKKSSSQLKIDEVDEASSNEDDNYQDNNLNILA